MKIIIKIARAELRFLFFSPIAWIILVAFFVVNALQLVTPLMEHARKQEVEVLNNPNWLGFLSTIPLSFSVFTGALSQVIAYLYLFIPLITMGSIGREYNNGSITLLASSPVTIREVVFGKYLGLSIYNFVLMAAIAIFLGTAYISVENAEGAWYISIWVGLFLLSSVYIAIGLFLSCLTNYQVLAGIGTYLLFFLLSVIKEAWPQLDFVRDITYYLSIQDRTASFASGLINSRDLLYFLFIIVLFIGWSVIKLRSIYEPLKRWVLYSRYIAWIVAIVFLGYLTSRPGSVFYLDVTRDQRNTIDSSTQAALSALDGSPLTVTLYANILGQNINHGVPAVRNKYVWDFWEKYFRFYPNIHFKYEYYYDRTKADSIAYSKIFGAKTLAQIAGSIARRPDVFIQNYKTPSEIHQIVDLSQEPMNLLMEMEYNGRKSFVRTFGQSPPWPSEANVVGSLQQLTGSRQPRVLFSTGHFERSPFLNSSRDYGNHTNNKTESKSLINLGVKVDTISLRNLKINSDIDLLVVADPRSSLHSEEQENIQSFIQYGGNVLFYAEPGKQHLLNPLLNEMGVNMENGLLVLPRKHVETHAFVGSMTDVGNNMARENAMQLFQRLGIGGASATFTGVGVLSYQSKNGFEINPIVTIPGNNNTWVENGLFVADSAAPTFSPEEGDFKREQYIAALQLTRQINGKIQRIVVTSDADFMSPAGKNGGSIGLGIYSWLLNNEYPSYSKLIIPKDNRVTISKKAGLGIRLVYVYIIPGLLLIFGAIILLRRIRR